jgi:epidermal growth factor receptor substrate 15
MGPTGASFDEAHSPAVPPGFPPQGIQPQNSGSVRVPPLTPDKVADYTRLFESAGLKPGGTLDGAYTWSAREAKTAY